MTPREKLERLAGSVPAPIVWLGLPSGVAAEVAALSGARLGLVDCEHAPIGPETMTDMIRALALHGASALVRLPELSEGHVKQALDAGAAGVMIPAVESAEDAARAVRAALYAPEGRRGAALGAIRASRFGSDTAYGPEWNARALTVVQVESRAGLAAADAIAAVDGIDMLFFGPFDYSQEAGLDPERDAARLGEAMAGVVEAARARGKLAGVFPWPGAAPADLARAGADMVAVAHDARVLGAGIRTALGEGGFA